MGQLTDADEVVGIERNHAMDQVIAAFSPAPAGGFIADVVRHRGCARRENRQVRAAGALQSSAGAFSRLSRIWSSLILGKADSGTSMPPLNPAIWSSRKVATPPVR